MSPQDISIDLVHMSSSLRNCETFALLVQFEILVDMKPRISPLLPNVKLVLGSPYLAPITVELGSI